MKSIAVFLIFNVLLLSAVVGKATIQQGTASCCISKAQKDCCRQQKKPADHECSKGACNAMLNCGACGFVVTLSLSISPAMIDLNNQIIQTFAIGELSDYHGNDWNPPKA
jgi:hypothetical protein